MRRILLLTSLLLFAGTCSAHQCNLPLLHAGGCTVSGGSVNNGDQFQSGGDNNIKLPVATPFVTSTGTYTPGNCFVYVGDTTSHTIDCGIYNSSSGSANSLLCHVTKTSTFAGGF